MLIRKQNKEKVNRQEKKKGLLRLRLLRDPREGRRLQENPVPQAPLPKPTALTESTSSFLLDSPMLFKATSTSFCPGKQFTQLFRE